MTPYTYFIRNTITNEFYYGSRMRNVTQQRVPEDDFWIFYFTSSKHVQKLITKYGKDSFETKIIFKNEDYLVCYWYEQLLIRENKSNVLCLNKKYQDPDKEKFCWTTANKKLSKETKEKISNSLKGKLFSLEHRTKIKEHHYDCSGNKNSFYGKKHSQETKEKISNSDYSSRSIKNPKKHSIGSFKSGKDHPRSSQIIINCKEYGSIAEASRDLQIPNHHVQMLLKGRTTLRGGREILTQCSLVF